MHAFSVTVFLMGVSAVMAVPTNDAMPQTVGEVAASIAASPHVDAAVQGFLAGPESEDPMDGHEVNTRDGENDDDEDNGDDDEWDRDDDDEDDANEWDDENDDVDDDNGEDDDVDDDNGEDDDGMTDDFGNEWTEENASEVSESNGKDGEDDMPSNASYEMSYDAEAGNPEHEGEGEADHSVDVDGDGEADKKDGEDDAMPPTAANTTATTAEAKPAAEKMSCTITAEGYSPKEMTVKPGSEISFKVDGEGEYSVKQTSGPNSCEPMAGGFSSKAMLKGDDWSYTVPQNATGKMYMYSGPADKCDTKMLATITVGDNLVADTKANSTAANPSGTSTVGLSSSAGSIAPALGSVAAAAVVAARTLF